MTGRLGVRDARPGRACPLRDAAPIGHLAGDGTATAATAAVFRALGHPTRLRIVGVLLCLGPATRAELTAAVGGNWSLIEHHLTTLRAAGLVTARPGRSRARYRVIDGLQADLATLSMPRRPNPHRPGRGPAPFPTIGTHIHAQPQRFHRRHPRSGVVAASW